MSGKKISDYDYLYLTSALRAKEPKMLTLDRINRMLEAPSFEEAAKLRDEIKELEGGGDN